MMKNEPNFLNIETRDRLATEIVETLLRFNPDFARGFLSSSIAVHYPTQDLLETHEWVMSHYVKTSLGENQ